MKRVHLRIEGMTCGHCVRAVEEAVRAVAGVNEVAVSLEENGATLEVEDSVTLSVLGDAITGAGYSLKQSEER